ncbi:MAG: hypothetical protein ACOCSD_06985 [Halolamina sp.]
MTSDDGPADDTTDEYVDLELEAEDRRAWVILFEEDYDNLLLDGDDRVALLVDEEQARELRRLADQAIGHCQEVDDGDD